MKLVRLSASPTGRLYPQKMFLVLIFTRGSVDPRAMVRSKGNMSLKNPVTPPGIDPGTVRLVAQGLNHYATLGPPGYLFISAWKDEHQLPIVTERLLSSPYNNTLRNPHFYRKVPDIKNNFRLSNYKISLFHRAF